MNYSQCFDRARLLLDSLVSSLFVRASAHFSPVSVAAPGDVGAVPVAVPPALADLRAGGVAGDGGVVPARVGALAEGRVLGAVDALAVAEAVVGHGGVADALRG